MRIVHILEATLGGTARHVIDLCMGMRRAGHEVHLIYNPRQGRVDAIFSRGLPVIEAAGVVTRAVDMPRAVGPADLRVVLAVRHYLRSHGPFDVVHGHSSKGGAYARLAAVRMSAARVYTPHAFVTTNRDLAPIAFRMYDTFERALGPLTSVVIAVSNEERAEALRLGLTQSRVVVVPNGVDPVEHRDVSRAALGLPERSVIVGTVGRLVPQKATAHLLRAFARAAANRPDLALAIVGSGPLEYALKQEADSLGISSRVSWLGEADGSSVMRTFDVFALSSIYEGFPYVLIEAVQLGLPIVTTSVGGASVVVEHGRNGLIVPVGDVAAMSSAIETVVSDVALRSSMSEHSLRRAPQFTAARMVTETLKVYKAAITSA